MNLILILLLMTGLSYAQTPVENFSLTNVVTGTPVTLESFNTKTGVAIIFTSNNCPFDQYYTARIKTLVNDYQDKIGFLLVNAHTDPDETVEKMKAAFSGWGIPVAYLSDKDQVLMNSLGAKRSPEVYLLNKVNGKYIVSYSGSVDDNAQLPEAVTTAYLKIAIDNLLAGKPTAESSTRAVGCSIKRKAGN